VGEFFLGQMLMEVHAKKYGHVASVPGDRNLGLAKSGSCHRIIEASDWTLIGFRPGGSVLLIG
jgi:hypothetical protein